MSIPTLKIPLNDKPLVQGDTIPSKLFEFDALDDIDLTGSTIKMQVYNGSTAFIDISTGSGITLIDDKSFEIDQVEKEDNYFPIGTFMGDLEITLANGDRRTFFRVEYTILNQYTI